MRTWALHCGILCLRCECVRSREGRNRERQLLTPRRHPKVLAFSTLAGGWGRHSDGVGLGCPVG